MDRRSFVFSGTVVCTTAIAGCLDEPNSAEISIVDGDVDRDGGDIFDVALHLERTGSGGEYDISVQISDSSGSIVRRRIRGEVDAETGEWEETTQIDLDDVDEVDNVDEEYEATAEVVEDEEGERIELETQ